MGKHKNIVDAKNEAAAAGGSPLDHHDAQWTPIPETVTGIHRSAVLSRILQSKKYAIE